VHWTGQTMPRALNQSKGRQGWIYSQRLVTPHRANCKQIAWRCLSLKPKRLQKQCFFLESVNCFDPLLAGAGWVCYSLDEENHRKTKKIYLFLNPLRDDEKCNLI
jgi:hypothetical protein